MSNQIDAEPSCSIEKILGKLDWIAIIAVLFCIASIYLYFSTAMLDYYLQSDYANEILFAQERASQLSLFPSDFYYPHETYTIRSLTTSFFCLFTSDLLHAQSMAIISDIALMTLSLVYLLGKLDLSKKGICMGVILFFGCKTFKAASLFGLASSIYSIYYTIAFFTIGYCLSKKHETESFLERILAFSLIMFAFLEGIASERLMLVLYIPVAVVWGFDFRFCGNQRSFFYKTIPMLCIAASLCGIALRQFNVFVAAEYSGGGHNLSGDLNKWHDVYRVGVDLINEFIQCYSLSPISVHTPALGVISIGSIALFLGVSFFLILILVAFKVVLDALLGQKYDLIVLSIFLSIILTLAVMILVPQRGSMRYLFLFHALPPILIALAYDKIDKRKILFKHGFLFYILLFSICSMIAYQIDSMKKNYEFGNLSNDSSRVISPLGGLRNSRFYGSSIFNDIQKEVTSKNMKMGYSSYWYAGVNTVLTNNKIIISSINLNTMIPDRWYVKGRNFSYRKSMQPCFLMLIDDLHNPLNEEFLREKDLVLKNKQFDAFLNSAKECTEMIFPEIPLGQIKASFYYFDYNPFILLNSPERDCDLIIYPAAPYMRKNGNPELERGTGALKLNPGSEPDILYGPYMPVNKGTYEIEVSYSTSPQPDSVPAGFFHIKANQGQMSVHEPQFLMSNSESLLVKRLVVENNLNDVEFEIKPTTDKAILVKYIRIKKL